MMAFFHPTVALIIRILLALLFIITGILKAKNLKKFFIVVVSFDVLKGKLAKLFAYTLPFAEIIVGILVMFNLYPVWSSGLLLLMIVVSTLGVVIALIKRQKIDDCGCYGGALKIPVTWKKVGENSIWILLSVYLFLFYIL